MLNTFKPGSMHLLEEQESPVGLFFVDKENLQEQTPLEALERFEKNEPGYQNTTIKAYLAFSEYPLEALLTFETFDQFHKALTAHIFSHNEARKSGPNHFGLSPDVTVDKEGLEDLIDRLSKQGGHSQGNYLDIKIGFPPQRFYLLNGQLQVADYFSGKVSQIGILNEEAIKWIKEKFSNAFFGGKNPTHILLNAIDSVDSKEEKVKSILGGLKEKLTNSQGTQGKEEAIFDSLRALSQTHLYIDGNARLIYLYANLIYRQLGFKPFYPQNQNLFDAMSNTGLRKRINQGQKNFEDFFGSYPEFLKKLSATTNSLKINKM